MDDDETTTSRGETYKHSIGQAAMEGMELMDDDLAMCMETYGEHVGLMFNELRQRGFEPGHAAQVLTGLTVGVIVHLV